MDQGNRMKGFPLFQVWGVPFQAIRNESRKTRDFSAFLSMVCAFSGNGACPGGLPERGAPMQNGVGARSANGKI